MTEKKTKSYPITQHGFDLGEVISALQKTIRRGYEKEAMYWALELVPYFEDYLWKRLVVISLEDIGLANSQVFSAIPALERSFMRFRYEGRDGSARLALANAILMLCRSEKTRLADEFQAVVQQEILQTDLTYEIPDYALDKHTRRGRQMKRGWVHFLEEGTRLENEIDGDEWQGYLQEANEFWLRAKKTKWGKKKRKGENGQPPLF